MTIFKSFSSKAKNRKIFLRALIIVIAPFLLISSKLQPWYKNDRVGVFLQSILYPVEYSIHKVSSSVTQFFSYYVFLSDTAQENALLKKEIFDLKTKVVLEYNKNIKEIERLRKLVGFKSSLVQSEVVAAEVLGHYNFASFQSFRISKGERHKLHIGMPVIAADGLVGKVLRVGSYFSDIQLITDTNFVVDVFVERTRVRAILHGTNESYCQMQLNRRADIKIGDTIISSGMLDLFPKGLPIGKVIRISHDTDEVSQLVKVQPWVEADSVEEVVVIQKLHDNIRFSDKSF